MQSRYLHLGAPDPLPDLALREILREAKPEHLAFDVR